ncbi:MAG: YlmC/YmxH family sporulation protein [Clostridia bacterium]
MQKTCTISDLKRKEVINLYNGMRLGYVCDVELDLEKGEVISVVVPGELRLFGLLGREEDIVIPWNKIDKIGDDIVIINFEFAVATRSKKPWFNL